MSNSKYGNFSFASVINKKNIYGCQFHPERSRNQGLIFLKIFVRFNMKALIIGLGSVGLKHYNQLKSLNSIKRIKVISKRPKKFFILL